MRLLLSALRCEKGAIDHNLAEHRRVLRAARDAGCALALLPEMSLTGSADPAVDPDARFIPEITHMQALEQRLRVMDSTALALCMENAMPIDVFNMDDETALARIISGERVGTLVSTSRGESDGR